jgi:energy-coupling factor transporter ATP-binding protein EcfA2
MRIVEIEIEQLFGTFHHRIRLNTEDRVTIIHGPNGFGKTILLEMVHGLFNGRYSRLRRIPFDQLVVSFDDGTRVMVRKQAIAGPPVSEEVREVADELFGPEDVPSGLEERPGLPRNEIRIVLQNGKARRGKEFKLSSIDFSEVPVAYIERSIPHLERIGGRVWFDQANREELALDDIFDIYGDQLPLSVPSRNEEPWWRDSE